MDFIIDITSSKKHTIPLLLKKKILKIFYNLKHLFNPFSLTKYCKGKTME
jgi:hypothetical protein